MNVRRGRTIANEKIYFIFYLFRFDSFETDLIGLFRHRWRSFTDYKRFLDRENNEYERKTGLYGD